MKKGDKRKLILPLTVRTSISVGTIPAGEVIEIQQVDEQRNQVLVESVWMYAPHIGDISDPLKEAVTNDIPTEA